MPGATGLPRGLPLGPTLHMPHQEVQRPVRPAPLPITTSPTSTCCTTMPLHPCKAEVWHPARVGVRVRVQVQVQVRVRVRAQWPPCA